MAFLLAELKMEDVFEGAEQHVGSASTTLSASMRLKDLIDATIRDGRKLQEVRASEKFTTSKNYITFPRMPTKTRDITIALFQLSTMISPCARMSAGL